MTSKFKDFSIQARNVHEALPIALRLIGTAGWEQESRNGPVVVSPFPVNTLYECPNERVLFWEERDANPFFHFMEGLWMLSGRNDVALPANYAKQIASYSDDGETLWGAYGHRWRNYFGFDQLSWTIDRLRKNPNDRRVVISMWDGHKDPGVADDNGKDVPCNTQLYLGILEDKLNMQVCCRSNDILWGCYGANAVHFSMLQEFLAAAIGVKLGYYVQSSWNWHVYVGFYRKSLEKAFRDSQLIRAIRSGIAHNPYAISSVLEGQEIVRPYPMINSENWVGWLLDLETFLNDGSGISDPFFNKVAVPLRASHRAYKEGDIDAAIHRIGFCEASDWRRACREWLERRKFEKQERDRMAKTNL